jgi:hypothetical protein
MGMSGTERKAVALAVASFPVAVLAAIGHAVVLDPSDPSNVEAMAVTLGSFALLLTGTGGAIVVQRRLWPSAERLFDRAFFLSMQTTFLVTFAGLLAWAVADGKWVSAALCCAVIGAVLRKLRKHV